MRYFPLFFDTHSLRLLVVGGGDVAARKLALWSRTEAQITAVSPRWNDEILTLDNPRLTRISERFEPNMLEGKDGVIVATNDAELNRQIAREAKALGLWINVVDQPKLCTVITPAIVDRHPMVIAIGSEGQAPVLVRTIRAMLETQLPRSLGKLATLIGRYRQPVQQKQADPRQFWERFIDKNGLVFSDNSEALLSEIDGDIQDGQLWLMHAEDNPNLLPIGIMPMLQRLDQVISEGPLNKVIAEIVRRDASRTVGLDLEQVKQGYFVGNKILLVVAKDRVGSLKTWFEQQGITVVSPYQP